MECAVVFDGCDDPERWNQMKDFMKRIQTTVDGKTQASIHFDNCVNILFKIEIDEYAIDFIRMMANQCDCDAIFFGTEITIISEQDKQS